MDATSAVTSKSVVIENESFFKMISALIARNLEVSVVQILSPSELSLKPENFKDFAKTLKAGKLLIYL